MDIIINIYLDTKKNEILDAINNWNEKKIEEVIKKIKSVTADLQSTPTK